MDDKRVCNGSVTARIRLDFKGKGRPGRLFAGRSLEQGAEEAREHHVTLFRNVPVQGVQIDDIDISGSVYTVLDEATNAETAYAPVVLTVRADSLEEMLSFVVRPEFRKIDIVEPACLELDRHHLERLLFRLAEEIVGYKRFLERKYNQ